LTTVLFDGYVFFALVGCEIKMLATAMAMSKFHPRKNRPPHSEGKGKTAQGGRPYLTKGRMKGACGAPVAARPRLGAKIAHIILKAGINAPVALAVVFFGGYALGMEVPGIEAFYRQNIGILVAAEVDARFNRVAFMIDNTTTRTSYQGERIKIRRQRSLP
jgi:hypothetical protein